MNKVTYKGIDYPTRTFNVILSDEGARQITIAIDSLAVAIGTDYEEIGSEAESVDDQIYFYVDKKVMSMDGELICREHLDEPMEFVSEENIEDDFLCIDTKQMKSKCKKQCNMCAIENIRNKHR